MRLLRRIGLARIAAIDATVFVVYALTSSSWAWIPATMWAAIAVYAGRHD